MQPIEFTVDDGSNSTTYGWTVSAGNIRSGQGTSQISVSGIAVGQSCEATVSMRNIPAGCSNKLTCTTMIVRPGACPTVNVSCPESVTEGSPAEFNASLTGGSGTVSLVRNARFVEGRSGGAQPQRNITYNWTVSAGEITSGQGTSSITVSTKKHGGETITATVEIGGISPDCSRTASCSVFVKP